MLHWLDWKGWISRRLWDFFRNSSAIEIPLTVVLSLCAEDIRLLPSADGDEEIAARSDRENHVFL